MEIVHSKFRMAVSSAGRGEGYTECFNYLGNFLFLSGVSTTIIIKIILHLFFTYEKCNKSLKNVLVAKRGERNVPTSFQTILRQVCI